MWHRTIPNQLKIQEINHISGSSFGEGVDTFGNEKETTVIERRIKEKEKK